MSNAEVKETLEAAADKEVQDVMSDPVMVTKKCENCGDEERCLRCQCGMWLCHRPCYTCHHKAARNPMHVIKN